MIEMYAIKGVIKMTIEYIQIDHIQICVPIDSIHRAKDFYIRILGFREIKKQKSLQKNGGFWCQAGKIQLHIGVEEVVPHKSKRHPAFEVQSIEQARKHLTKYGVKIYEETEIPGVIRFSIRDPFGNRIELLEKKN